jgi:hypothetical protein
MESLASAPLPRFYIGVALLWPYVVWTLFALINAALNFQAGWIMPTATLAMLLAVIPLGYGVFTLMPSRLSVALRWIYAILLTLIVSAANYTVTFVYFAYFHLFIGGPI